MSIEKPMDILNQLRVMLESRVTPEEIVALEDHEVFVFGAKPDGNHVKEAAKTAMEKFGATQGKVEGLSGQSYAIPVHRYRTEIMADAIDKFIDFAKSNPKMMFYVLPIGCGSAGMNVNIVANMFNAAIGMDNIFLPESFIKSLIKTYRVSPVDPLPIKYVREEIDTAVLHGRAMGLMVEVSKRTDDPITFEDRILKEDNVLLHAFLRTAKVITPEEQRVLSALLEEAKNTPNRVANPTYGAFMFVKGCKIDAIAKLEDGGSIYDLLEFTDKEYFEQKWKVEESVGYRGTLPGADHVIKIIDGKKSLCDNWGNIVCVPEFDDIVSSGWSGRGWKVKSGDKWGMLNERFEVIIPIEFDQIEVIYEGGFMVNKDGKWGYLPTDGPIDIKCIYDDVDRYIVSDWNAFRAKKEGRWGVVNFEGETLISFEYDGVSLGECGMAMVKYNNKYGFINVFNGVVIPCDYDYAESFSSGEDMAVIGRNGLKGVIGIDGSVILPIEYDYISIDGKNRLRVIKNGRYGILDRESKVIFPFVYRDLGKFDNEGITYAMNEFGKYGYVNERNTVLIEFQFTRARNFDRDGYAEVSKGYHQTGVIDKDGKIVVPLRYADVSMRLDGLIKVSMEDNMSRYVYGAYDLKTGGTIPCRYTRIESLKRNSDGIMEFNCWSSNDSDPEKRLATNDPNDLMR